MDEPLPRVLLVAGRFDVRGTSAYTLRLAENLGDEGFEVRVICPDASLVPAEKRSKLGIEEYRYLETPFLGRMVLRSLARQLLLRPPDLIHVQSREALANGTKFADELDAPLILTVHDYLARGERLRFDVGDRKRIIAVSGSVKSELIERTGFQESAVTVIHTGVESGDGAQVLPVLDPGHVPVVGTAGPLEAVKGIPFFLGAAQRVLAANAAVQFLVSGAGPEEPNLRRLARDLGIGGQVTFVPNLLDYSASLGAMDIYCLPSLRQGLGTIMLDAMAMGRPVIATGVGGVYSAVRDNETGLVIPPSDSKRLAERILELLDDPVRARAIGEAGRAFVREEFSIEKMLRQTADLYRAVLASKQVVASSAGETQLA